MPAQRRSHRALRFSLLAGILATHSLSAAEPAPSVLTTSEPTHTARPECQQPNTLAAISCELGSTLPSAIERIVVASEPGTLPLQPLARRLAALVAGRLDVRSLGVFESVAAARTQAQGARHLLWLQPKLTGARLEVGADVYVLHSNLWDRAKAGSAAPIAHTFASRPIDAEVGSFLPKVPLVITRIDKARAPNSVQAIACGDIDNDASLEIALATRHEIYLGRIASGAFAPNRTTAWSKLSEVSPNPLQEPISTLSLSSGFLEAGSSDRAEWVRLDPELEVLLQRPDQLPWPGRGCTARRGLGLSPELVDCESKRSIEQLPIQGELDAVSGSKYVTASGQVVEVVAARGRGQSHLELLDSEGRRARISDAGAQVSLGDLNRDGTVEIATSRATLDPDQDVLSVHSWELSQAPVTVITVPAPGGIRALTSCPPEDGGLMPLVAAVGEEIWVIR